MIQKQQVNIRDLRKAGSLAKRVGIKSGDILEFATSLGLRTLEVIFEDREELNKFIILMAKKNNYLARTRDN